MWEWRLFGELQECTTELLDGLATTLGALKVSQALHPERRSDLFTVLPMPNLGIKFRNLGTASTKNLEIKVAKEIESTCGAQRWLKKRVVVPDDIDMYNDEHVRQAILASGVEELEQVEIKFPLQRLLLTKERQQWRLAMTACPVEITSVSIAVNGDVPAKEKYFTICVEAKSAEAVAECLVKLNIGNLFEQYALQNIYVVQAIHIKPPQPTQAKTAPVNDSMVPPSSGASPESLQSPVKRKIAAQGARLRLIEMSYPAFACQIIQAQLRQE
ncbi:hypothetical protein LEN26_000548 [Aphanomyces euteiches]|nr:hypothetical protein AeMF1_011501 [Aphanomyces euteiches]KAH9163342.1 hypothetical protein LEN26_000548 [Aphanomyces euteiches]KAH9193956.1 hypothetical protein AeNC1_004069 [Aphanomyces euteiches]